jgi:AcrR family transcriptional regulator
MIPVVARAATDPRRERAAATRRRMVKAAYHLFSTRGLSTPMPAIAEKAGVAVQTLYFTFHTKSHLLMEAHDYAVLGEDAIEPGNHAAMVRMRGLSDQRSVIDAVVQVSRDIIPRIGPLLWHMQTAVEDPEIVSALAHRERLRVDGYAATIDELMRRGPLREGVDREMAIDIMLALTSVPLTMFLIRERGWTFAAWAEWTVDCLCERLLPSARSRIARGRLPSRPS